MNEEILVRGLVRRNRAAGSHAFVHSEGEFFVYEEVFSPTVFNDTFFYAEALPVPAGGSVLEVGCGSGFIALTAAKKGAGSVLATDINPSAVANCKANSEKHNLSNVVTARISDVFSAVTPDERFDLIFWNWPFLAAQRNEDDPLECSVFDPTYDSIGRYLRDARAHRSPQGRVMLSFSREAGNVSLLEQRASEAGASLSTFRTSEDFDGSWVLEILEATYDVLRHIGRADALKLPNGVGLGMLAPLPILGRGFKGRNAVLRGAAVSQLMAGSAAGSGVHLMQQGADLLRFGATTDFCHWGPA